MAAAELDVVSSSLDPMSGDEPSVVWESSATEGLGSFDASGPDGASEEDGEGVGSLSVALAVAGARELPRTTNKVANVVRCPRKERVRVTAISLSLKRERGLPYAYCSSFTRWNVPPTLIIRGYASNS